MAEIEVELVLGKLLSVEELAQRLDADELTKAIERRLSQVIRKVVNDVMAESAPQLWAALPVQGKNLSINASKTTFLMWFIKWWTTFSTMFQKF